MDSPKVPSHKPLETEKLQPKTQPPPQNDSPAAGIPAANIPLEEMPVAWESIENDLWIPYRIRGSWRGGVLG